MDGKTPETGEKKKSLLIFSCICAVGICEIGRASCRERV